MSRLLALIVSYSVLLSSASALPVQDEDFAEEIEAAKKQLKSKDPDVRLEGLRAIAKFGRVEDPPSEKLAKLLAGGFKDKSIRVKAETAVLMGKGQPPDVAVPALCKAIVDVQKMLARTGRSQWGTLRSNKPEDLETKEYMMALSDYSKNVVVAVQDMPDDRVMKALIEFHKKLPGQAPFEVHEGTINALISFEGRPGVETVINAVAMAPTGGGGGRGGRSNKLDGQRLHQKLTRMAVTKDLTGMPGKFEAGTGSAWRKWFGRNAKHFPSKLGKLKLGEPG